MALNRNDEIDKRIYLGLFYRSYFSVFAYIILLPIIFHAVNLYQNFSTIAWVLTGITITLCGFRLYQIKTADKKYSHVKTLWLQIFGTTSCIFSSIISIILVLSVYSPLFSEGYTLTIVVCAGITGGVMSALTPALPLAIAQIVILLVPATIAHLLIEEYRAIGITMLVYFTYTLMITIKINKEYLRTFDIEEQLAKQKQKLEVLSQTDPLTGLYNRGHFDTLFQHLWKSAKRNQTRLSLSVMDLDHFKKVNDNYGHSSGDECLKVMAKILKQYCPRESDLCCRYGGEEFLIVMQDASIEHFKDIAEKIRQQLSETWIEHGKHRFKVTTSIGIASCIPQQDAELIELIDQADQALYSAKNYGRNCVVSAHNQTS
jgi:diguanylate cyclase (GGDEF)-like protein